MDGAADGATVGGVATAAKVCADVTPVSAHAQIIIVTTRNKFEPGPPPSPPPPPPPTWAPRPARTCGDARVGALMFMLLAWMLVPGDSAGRGRQPAVVVTADERYFGAV